MASTDDVPLAPETSTKHSNPLLRLWTTPFGIVPFAEVSPHQFREAFACAMAAHQREIDAIAQDLSPPSFENTIVALERSGQMLTRVGAVFWNLVGADTSDMLQAIEREFSPVLAKHFNDIQLNPELFGRIDALHRRADELALDPESFRVLDLAHRNAVRAGARLAPPVRARLSEISQRLASLATQFSQNVLKDESSFELILEDSDLAGLPDWFCQAAARTARDRGKDGKFVVTLSRSSVEPFLQFSARRDLREKAFRAWTSRGEHTGPTDNREIIKETVQLRAEIAALMGFKSFADYKLDDTMAKMPAAVRSLLSAVWQPALRKAAQERAEIEEEARRDGENYKIEAHDWRYFATKAKHRLHHLDEAEIKPYLPLERMIEAAFYTAHKLFDISFSERHDVPVYHPDVRIWEVTDRNDRHVALFLGDYFARPNKHSGAWMSAYRAQHKLNGEVRPIIVNVLNLSKGAEGKPALLNLDDARTIFHEFGHALHGMLSNVTFPLVAGTNVVRDFVEFPSQVFEHWLLRPEILRQFARHSETGQPMPPELLQRFVAARNFGQGFATLEYAASAYVDLELHAADHPAPFDPIAFERAVLADIGMPVDISMRHRTPHFSHIFSGDSYSAGYYSYLWSEVLDADGFLAFEESGDIFDPVLSRRLLENVYAAGSLREPLQAYVAFRGREPTIQALLANRGFIADTARPDG
jgi:peptidyl-dipeptidase Dcp